MRLFALMFFVLLMSCQKAAKLEDKFMDPLPSWNETYIKKSIIDYVTKVSTKGNKDFIPEDDRIAMFDNDGTLWSEVPVIQGMFALERAKAMNMKVKSVQQMELQDMLKLVIATHTGMTEEAFTKEVRKFFETSEHPKFHVPFHRTVYKPQKELIEFLKKNGFKVFISSGGTVDFMRAISERYYDIPPEQVIGSSFDYSYDTRRNTLERVDGLEFINDKQAKAIGIQRHIGKRPVFTCGNVRSGGDIYMLRFSQGSPYSNFQLLINHDDPIREFSYQEKDGISLKWAKKYHWNVLSMKNDWKEIFPSESLQISSK